jgi:hypothetical protein
MIEQTIYERLNTYAALAALVGSNIYPTTPTENTALPFITYTITGKTPTLRTQGDAGLNNYTLDLDVYGINLDTVLAIMTQTNAALHCYRTDNLTIQGSFLTTQATQQEEYGFHGSQSFTVWGT